MRNDWRQIEPLRQAVDRALFVSFGEDPKCETVAMVTSELLENAVKYGHSGCNFIPVEVLVDSNGIAVSVTNQIDRDTAHLEALFAQLAWIASFLEPGDAYRGSLGKAYRGQEGQLSGGLGLARIAYEGQCAIQAAQEVRGLVTVRASRRPGGYP